MTQDEIKRAFEEGEFIDVDRIWVFSQVRGGRICGCCGDPACCEWDFDNVDEFWEFWSTERDCEISVI